MRRARPWPLLAGALGVLAGVALGLLSLQSADQRAEVVGGDLPIDPSALDRLDRTANNSPTVVVNPRDPANLVVVNRIDSPDFGCALEVSFDGGSRWATPTLPTPPGVGARCLAPDAAFSSDGTLHVAFSSFANLPSHGPDPAGVFLISSGDGGRHLSAPRQVEGPLAFGVRLVADRQLPRRLHLCWVQAAQTTGAGFATDGNPILAARSDDGGTTWGTPVRLNPPGQSRVVAPTLVSGVDGALHVAYLDLGDDRLDYSGSHQGRGGEPYDGSWALRVATSHDGGVTWADAAAEPRLIPTRRIVALLAPTPALAVDPHSGRLYAAFQDGRLGDADVYLWASADGGRSWGPARRVNDTRAGDGTAQYLPALAVAPDGRLDVLYYDRRSDPADVLVEVSLQSSRDGGQSFSPRLRVSDAAFDSQVGFGYQRGLPELGSRLALTSTDSRVLALWADTREGGRLTMKQDIAKAVIAVREAMPLRLALRPAGLAAVLAGLILMGWALRGRPAQPDDDAATPPPEPPRGAAAGGS